MIRRCKVFIASLVLRYEHGVLGWLVDILGRLIPWLIHWQMLFRAMYYSAETPERYTRGPDDRYFREANR